MFNYRAFLIQWLVLVLQPIAASCAESNLDIKLHIFEQPYWTWAASTQSVLEYYGHDLGQCTVATYGYENNCCFSPWECNKEIPPVEVGNILDLQFDIQTIELSGAIPWSDCVTVINNGRPFMMELDYWNEEIMEPIRTSYVVARGYDPAYYSIVYLDPKYGYMEDSYDFLTGFPYVYELGVYAVLDWGATISIYNNPKPDCELGDATPTTTTAHLTGTVNANSRPTSATFRVSQSSNFIGYFESSPFSLSGPDDWSISSDASLLTPGTTYYYKIRAVSDGGVCESLVGSFTTNPLQPPQTADLQVFVIGQGTVTNVYPLSPVVNTASYSFVTYPFNTWVGLMATPAAGSGFAGWSYADMGFACSGTGQCNVLMNAPKSVAATFAPFETLTVTKSGAGIGTVVSTAPSSPTINCGPTCSNSYLAYDAASVSTAVTLIAIPDVGNTFTGWSGSCSGTGSCSVDMDVDRTISASFLAANPVKVGASYYATIQTAYDNAGAGNEIKLIAAGFNESLNFSRPIDVTIQGGYNSNFSERIGNTTVNGVMTIGSGIVTVDRIQIGGQ